MIININRSQLLSWALLFSFSMAIREYILYNVNESSSYASTVPSRLMSSNTETTTTADINQCTKHEES